MATIKLHFKHELPKIKASTRGVLREYNRTHALREKMQRMRLPTSAVWAVERSLKKAATIPDKCLNYLQTHSGPDGANKFHDVVMNNFNVKGYDREGNRGVWRPHTRKYEVWKRATYGTLPKMIKTGQLQEVMEEEFFDWEIGHERINYIMEWDAYAPDDDPLWPEATSFTIVNYADKWQHNSSRRRFVVPDKVVEKEKDRYVNYVNRQIAKAVGQ